VNSDFRNLEVWQLAMDLADRAYDAAEMLPASERFVLNVQMRKAALSVPANIAEGKGRWSIREYRQFVRHARGSALELQTHVLFAGRRKFLTEEHVGKLIADAEQVVIKINALLRYLNRQAKKPPVPTTHDPRPNEPEIEAMRSQPAAPTSPASASPRL
jgi:four helix bundle protein